jgi:uncharacterized protein YggE
MKMLRLVGLAALAAAAVAFAGVGRPEGARSDTSPAAKTISVTGAGSVTTVPNRAAFSFGVVSQARTATAALAANATEMRNVIAALLAAGVARADIQTQGVSLSARTTDNGETIVGYTASNSVSATVRDLNKAGRIVDAAVAAGANQVFGPSLTRSDSTGLYRRALRAAVADARTKASAIAAASHVRLGRVRSVVEQGASPPPQPLTAERGAIASTTPIEPGTQLVQANVTVEFAIA